MIVGLRYLADFITPEQHDELLQSVDAEPWLTDLKRRVQHYGYKYDYPARKTDQYQGRSIVRGRRVSLTFRKVIID